MTHATMLWLMSVIFATMIVESSEMWLNSSDGGYTDIVVYIDDDIPESNAFLDNIKVGSFMFLFSGVTSIIA